MNHAYVYDRTTASARRTCTDLLRGNVPAFPLEPDAFDPTFETGGVPHLIVTELDMLPVDGLDLIRQVRAFWSAVELPIVVYTSSVDPETFAAAMAAGANELVNRDAPDAAERLSAAVERCLRRTIPALSAPQPAVPIDGFRRMLASTLGFRRAA
ncbi:MAG: hypothetical protein JWO31_2315 [Phycisphaerales bacterium]|nr:hypothetical protein [Phycisphaerales bacterium]